MFKKQFISLLFLAALVFAMAGKTIHVLSEDGHEHDFICSETSTHFHEQEHACFICDFELHTTDGLWPVSGELNIFTTEFAKASVFRSFNLVKQSFSFDSRGPPVVA